MSESGSGGTHTHELVVTTDHDPSGLAFGLVRAFGSGDDLLMLRLLAVPAEHPEIGRKALAFLVDLVVPVQVHFEAPPGARREHKLLEGLVLARGTGLSDVYDAILAAGELSKLLIVAAQLVGQLHERGKVSLPQVHFGELNGAGPGGLS